MPEGTATFEVRAPIERVWAFVSDMRMIGGCVPGVQSVEILDETRARWNLKVKIGPLSQDIEVLTETLEQVPLKHGKFREDLDILGQGARSEEHTSELQSRQYLVCRLLLEIKKNGQGEYNLT